MQFVYLNDIFIFSSNFQKHYKRIRKVFERIKEPGLEITPNKFHFMRQGIKCLGHVINQEGLQTEKKKNVVPKNFEKPKCIKKLRSFLGLTNYYRRFIRTYTEYSKVLKGLCGSNKNKLI